MNLLRNQRERYRAWRKAGLCGKCGNCQPRDGYATCAPCGAKLDVWRANSRARRLALRPPKHREWTLPELARLVALFKRGDLLGAIATELGRSRAAVESRVIEMGLRRRAPKRFWTAERVAVLREMHAEWIRHADIGAALGVTECAAIAMALKLGLRRGRGNPKHLRGRVLESDRMARAA